MKIILIAIVLCGIVYIYDFPGGPSGFANATKLWLKRTKDKIEFSLKI